MRLELKVMKAKNISYPYPVVGNEDDVPNGVFKAAYFKHVLRRDKIDCKVGFELKNKAAQNLIAQKKAAFTAEIECNSTFYRTLVKTFEREAEFSIDAARVREMVGVGFYVRALQPISNYLPDGSHPDYKGLSFDISAGDVLAVGGSASFDAEKEFDPLRPSVSAFITINAGKNKRGPMAVDYSDHDKIVIKLPQEDWENYKLVKGRKPHVPVLHAGIVLPVLAEAIGLVRKNDDETRGSYWFQRLQVILEQNKLLDSDPLSAAQEILKYPVERALLSLAAPAQEDE